MFLFLMSVFMFRPAYTQLMMHLPFMKVDPKFSGGVVVATCDYPDHRLHIREAVYPALIGQGDDGFVQLDIAGDVGALTDTVDYDADGVADFVLSMSGGEFTARTLTDAAYSAYTSCTTDSGYIVRVSMLNPDAAP